MKLRLVLALGLCMCGERTLPPLGEALFIIDTDSSVPNLVGRLRIDFYEQDGRWYQSREVLALKPSNWPMSFSAYLPEGEKQKTAIVRLRAFPDGKVRDYRGERYMAKPPSSDSLDPPAQPPATDKPRLLTANGDDITPSDEPEPLVTIDRLVKITLEEGKRGSVRVVLRTACSGTMANIGKKQTCIDTEGELQAVTDAALDPKMDVGTSVVGSFETEYAKPCAAELRPSSGPPVYDDEVCVTGGVFIFGSHDAWTGDDSSDLPERVAVVPSFRMDKYEVSVARFRAAKAKGFTGTAVINSGPLGDESVAPESQAMCTYSLSPTYGREDYPINCITFSVARAFCQFEGGDLPLEVQWEYAAAAAGRSQKTHFPWGDNGNIGCKDAVYARGGLASGCGWGPLPVNAIEHDGGDVSIGFGLVSLGGGIGERAVDAYANLGSTCWLSSSFILPHCFASATVHALRGASWAGSGGMNLAAARRGGWLTDGEYGTADGFRCARSGDAP